VPRSILINPEIRPLSADMEDGWEGCLSVPGLRGVVPRYQRIEYRGFNAEGEAVLVEADGFHARVVQHECDHLDGILYPQRMSDFNRFGFMDELAAAGRLDVQPCDT
jgi:peptide deformylase